MPRRRPDAAALVAREAAPRGREAFYGAPSSAAAEKSGGGRRSAAAPSGEADPRSAPAAAPAGRWSDRHHLVSFHCPIDLLEQLEAEVAASGRRKGGIIVEALREHLGKR